MTSSPTRPSSPSAPCWATASSTCRPRSSSCLPEGEPLYPPDQETEATERFLTAELIRERVLHHAKEEVPHAVAVTVEEFDESARPHLVRIRAVIYVERTSQKGIIIGKNGIMLKTIGAEARKEIEALLGRPRLPGPLGQGLEELAQGPPGPAHPGLPGVNN